MPGIYTHRVQVDEVKLLRNYCTHPQFFPSQPYPKAEHAAWLERALVDTQGGVRAAFVALTQDDDFNHGTDAQAVSRTTVFEDDSPERDQRNGTIDASSIVGSVILKCQSSNVVELKCLLLRDEQPPRPSPQEVGSVLLRRVDTFCKRRGYRRIELEVPSDQSTLIQILLRQGFQLQSSRRSVYVANDNHYLLVKHLSPSYSGDPFADLSIAEWVLRERFGWQLNPAPFPYTSDLDIPFALAYRFGIANQIGGGDAAVVTGTCVIDQGKGPLAPVLDLLKDDPDAGDLRVVFCNHHRPDGIETQCKVRRIKLIDVDTVRELAGPEGSPSLARFSRAQLGGVLLEVDGLYAGAVREKATQGARFAYFLFNGLGESLCEQSDDDRYAVFCTTRPVDGAPHPVIWAYARIAKVSPESRAEAFTHVPAHLRIIPDFEKYGFHANRFAVNFNRSGLVQVLYLDEPRLLAKDIPLGSVNGGLEDLSDQIVASNVSAVYLKRSTLDAIIRDCPVLSRTQGTPQPDPSSPVDQIARLMIKVTTIVGSTANPISADLTEKLRSLLDETVQMTALSGADRVPSREFTYVECAMDRYHMAEPWRSERYRKCMIGSVCRATLRLLEKCWTTNIRLPEVHKQLDAAIRHSQMQIDPERHRKVYISYARDSDSANEIRAFAQDVRSQIGADRTVYYADDRSASGQTERARLDLLYTDVEYIIVVLEDKYRKDGWSKFEWDAVTHFHAIGESWRILYCVAHSEWKTDNWWRQNASEIDAPKKTPVATWEAVSEHYQDLSASP